MTTWRKNRDVIKAFNCSTTSFYRMGIITDITEILLKVALNIINSPSLEVGLSQGE
jgi:hypothetical protein